MFFWYIEWAAKDHHLDIGVGIADSEGWQARLIADAEATHFQTPASDKPEPHGPTPPLKHAS